MYGNRIRFGIHSLFPIFKVFYFLSVQETSGASGRQISISFQKAVHEIEATRTANWTNIAHESGYYDQAHFINDFKKFSGFTPHQFLSMKSSFTNYVAVE